MSENELQPIDAQTPAISGGSQDVTAILDNLLPAVTDTSVMQELSPFVGWLPFVILLQPASPFCAPPHRVPQGDFVCRKSKTEILPLSDTVDILPIDWRPKAMKPASDKPGDKKLKILFDRNDPEFLEVQDLCKKKVRGYFWGYEFLIYLPDHGIYATLFCNNPTLQNAARSELINFIRKPCSLKSVEIVKEEMNYRWYGFTVLECTSPFQIPVDSEKLLEVHKRFRDQVERRVEEEEEASSGPVDTRER